ncbi:MAG: hypothetical protein ACYDGM_09675 [Vulcanimicrobiaceae bacterium]
MMNIRTQAEAQQYIASMPGLRVIREVAQAAGAKQSEIKAKLRAYPLAERGPLATATQAVAAFREVRAIARAQKIKARPWCRRAKAVRSSLSARLADLRKRALASAFGDVGYRTSTHGSVEFVFSPDGRATVEQTDYQDWDVYAKSYGHPAQVRDTKITVPINWRVQVQRAGLAEVGGMLTLRAIRLDSPTPGIEAWDASWLVQRRGTALAVESGCIVRQGDVTAHGCTLAAAIQTLSKKIDMVADAAAVERMGNLPLASIVQHALAVAPAIMVRVQDARAVGACASGIASWCARVGLAEADTSLARVYEAYQMVPATEARAAILHAIRRQRAYGAEVVQPLG